MLIWPPQVQIHLHVVSSVGMNPVVTEVLPVIQGATVMGMQGIGVSTPKAAAVAAATVGLAILIHVPKVGILTSGAKFMMVPTVSIDDTIAVGVTVRGAGAAPKVQVIRADVTQI